MSDLDENPDTKESLSDTYQYYEEYAKRNNAKPEFMIVRRLESIFNKLRFPEKNQYLVEETNDAICRIEKDISSIGSNIEELRNQIQGFENYYNFQSKKSTAAIKFALWIIIGLMVYAIFFK